MPILDRPQCGWRNQQRFSVIRYSCCPLVTTDLGYLENGIHEKAKEQARKQTRDDDDREGLLCVCPRRRKESAIYSRWPGHTFLRQLALRGARPSQFRASSVVHHQMQQKHHHQDSPKSHHDRCTSGRIEQNA